MTSKLTSVPRLLGSPLRTGLADSYDGVKIYWELHGPSAPTAPVERVHLFCYGLACSYNQWRFQVNHYCKEDYCLVFDYRGHHLSEVPRTAQAFNMASLAKDAAAVLRASEVQRAAHVWGHSMGCSVAVELAAAEPSLVKTLNLCCGSLSNPFEHMFGNDWLNVGLKPLLELYDTQPHFFNAGWNWAQKQSQALQLIVKLAGFNMDASSSDDVETYVKAVSSVEPRVFFSLLKEMTRSTTKPMASRVKSPACIVAGTKDKVTPPVKQKEMAKLLQNSHYIEIPAGSHNVQTDFGDYLCLKVERHWQEKKLW